jgi:hypothetical protein
MPIWLRAYTYNEIKQFYDKQKEAQSKESFIDPNKPSNIKGPDIASPQTDYVTKKAPKK